MKKKRNDDLINGIGDAALPARTGTSGSPSWMAQGRRS
jgi:hypothetical protein